MVLTIGLECHLVTMGSSRSFKLSKMFFLVLWLISLLWVSFATLLSWEMFQILPSAIENGSGSTSSGGLVMSWDEYSWCYDSYCWSSKNEFFLKVEEKFIADMASGLHTKIETESNKCKWYHISSIAYGFSAVEHGNRDSNMAVTTHNVASLKESGNDYQYMRKPEYGKYKWYLVYPNKFEALLDFMHLYKYGYGCFVGKKWVGSYKEWSNVDITSPNFRRYYGNLIKYIEAFENENFKN